VYTKYDLYDLVRPGNTKGEVSCTDDLLFDLFGLVCYANKNKNCQSLYSWFQTGQTGGQQYSDTSPLLEFPGQAFERLGQTEEESVISFLSEESPETVKERGLSDRVAFVANAVLTDAQLPDLERVDLDDVDEGAVVGDGDVVRKLQAFVGDVEGAGQLVRL